MSEERRKALEQLHEILRARRDQDESGEQSSASPAADVSSIPSRRADLEDQSFAEEIALKKSYGNWLLVFLAIQLVVMNIVFILVGSGRLEYQDYVLHLYMTGTLLEIFGLVLVVTKYLFRR